MSTTQPIAKRAGLLSFLSRDRRRKSARKRGAGQARFGIESLEAKTLLTTLHVNIDDPDCGSGPVYCEIQDAVEDAESGDHIAVAAGTYSPVIVEDDNITIREAHQHSNPTIDATGSAIGVTIGDHSGVTIRGLEVRNAGRFGFSIVGGSDNRLVNNIANENGAFGFYVNAGTDNTFLGNTANHNQDCGFLVEYSEDNTFINNTAKHNTFIGFVLGGSADNTFLRNTAAGNGDCGFLVAESNDNSLVNNTATDNQQFGFVFHSSNNNAIVGNTASQNGVHGFFVLASDDNKFAANEAEENGAYGFHVDAVLANMFKGNRATDNVIAGDNQGAQSSDFGEHVGCNSCYNSEAPTGAAIRLSRREQSYATELNRAGTQAESRTVAQVTLPQPQNAAR